MTKILITFAIASVLIGCSQITGMMNPHLSDENLTEGVIKRASFDLDCATENINVQELSRSQGGFINSFGVSGCGKKAVFVRALDSANWILNSNELNR